MVKINNPQSSSMVGGCRRRGYVPMAVTKRRRVWPNWWRSLMVRTMLAHVTPMTRLGVQLAVIFWSAWGFKYMEPVFFPVVTDFKITHATFDDDSVHIAGTMKKIRDCQFVEVVAYSNQHLVNIKFTETSNTVSRIQGNQAWDWWELTPAVNRLKLYALHECWSGKITTPLFEGELPK